MLYLVPTPIGNLEDITYRAVRVLGEVDLILAEDTRNTKRLLNHYGIEQTIKSYHAHNEHGVTPQIIEQLQAGQHMALVTDAGTPGISDPGFLLVRACTEADIPVASLPGATAFVTALVASGIPCNQFFFEGFLPHKKGRKTRLTYLAELPCTFVLYESTHRILKCLDQLIEHCGPDRLGCVARELTKVHEEVQTAPLEALKKHFEENVTKGEFVIIVAGKK